jgi:hypothetical protein
LFFVPDVETHFVHRHVFQHRATGAVDQHIEFAELRYRSVDGLLDLRILRDIRVDENHVAAGGLDFLLGLLARFSVDVDDGDFGAFFDEFKRVDFGDAGATASEEGNFSIETAHDDLEKLF